VRPAPESYQLDVIKSPKNGQMAMGKMPKMKYEKDE
jgi:hypothetical protein